MHVTDGVIKTGELIPEKKKKTIYQITFHFDSERVSILFI